MSSRLQIYTYSENCRTSKTEFLAIFFSKIFHTLAVWKDAEYAYGLLKLLCHGFKRVDTWEGWYMPIWLSIHSKLRIFSLMRMSYIEIFCSFFHFLCSSVSDNKSKCYEQKWCVLYFTCIKLVAWHTGMCVCDGMHQMEKIGVLAFFCCCC